MTLSENDDRSSFLTGLVLNSSSSVLSAVEMLRHPGTASLANVRLVQKIGR